MRCGTGSSRSRHKRPIRWAVDGTWEEIFAAGLAAADAVDDIGWTVSVDSTAVRAHQPAAGALRRGLEAVTNHPLPHSDAPSAAGPPRCRTPGFDAASYKQRNTVERCINRLNFSGAAWPHDATNSPSPTRPHSTSP